MGHIRCAQVVVTIIIQQYRRWLMQSDKQVMILMESCDVIETELPFGKRWGDERITLTMEHINALQEGQIIAVDVQDEYVIFIELKKTK